MRNDKYPKLIAYIYNTPLSYVTELFNLFKPSFLLIPIKIHLKVAPFAFDIAISFRACSLVVSDLRSETKGSRFESGC